MALAVVMVGIVAMVWLEASPVEFGAASALGVALMGVMRRVYRPSSSTPPPPLPVLLFVGLAAMAAQACGTSASRDAASAGYLAQQLECVDYATTLAESRECRAKVREAWGVDAGAEGGAQ
ncbi:MAG: hypothetical protein FWD69_10085 [Polyangiaceae bacterium]|nr:hypothetical protein [Polyangiaceae bacterium]